MLHQILCALLGKTGSVIKRYPKQIAVDPSINYLSNPQIQLVNEICRSGFYYSQITQLINAQFSLANINFTLTKSPSVYRKAIYSGVSIALKEYTDLILGIQACFLKNRHFTFANIRAEIQPFELVMKQIWEILSIMNTQNHRGGVAINFLYKKYQTASANLKKWLYYMLNQAIKVFVNQVNSWILYGQIIDSNGQFFVHKVINERSQKFKFKGKSYGKNIEITDWDMFTLQQYMIPKCLIQLQTAGKILFIGKSIKILRSADRISSTPDSIILQKIQKVNNQTQYSQIQYQGMIQQIRSIIAKKMIEFIMKEQNLIKELSKLNDYYLMFKGDFYHHFFQEAKGIETIALKQKAQKKINQKYLQNTFIRLGQHEDVKRIMFQIKTLGFIYNTFRNFVNLCPVGNVDLLEGKAIRFNSSGSAVWNRSKQVIESNFTMVYSFSFRKIHQIYTINKSLKSKQPTYLNMVIENSNQISGSIYENPSDLRKIRQYIVLKVGFEYSQEQQNYVSSMLIATKDPRIPQKQLLISKILPKGINFLDQRLYTVKLSFANDTLSAFLTGGAGQKNEIKIQDFRINTHVNLEMGKSYLGFLSNINESQFAIDLQQWEMICKPLSFCKSHWSDLSLNFRVDWPINLIINQDLIEAYGRIHKFLFPIRQLQIEIQSMWFEIPRLIKAEEKTTPQQKYELKIFQRNLAVLRSQIGLVINNFWAYFHSDIAQVLWNKLSTSLNKQNDFEDVISAVNRYVKSIQVMFFFNVPKIQKKLNQLFEKVKQFTLFFHKLMNQSYIDQHVFNDLETIDMEFNGKLLEFCDLLKDLSKMNTSQYMYHLTNRMESCLNPKKFTNI